MDYNELIAFTENLDRSSFLEAGYKQYAQIDEPLPIGFGQTISQPSLVAQMTWLLRPDKSSRVLEIGTGSGYQTAILAEFSGQVYTVERIRELSDRARDVLDSMGYANIHYKVGDGSDGWSENAPYDRIMVTAAASEIPEELIDQLSPGGRMLIPVGPRDVQELVMLSKDSSGEVYREAVENVRFVELIGKYGWG
ncbi:protein-L-isoaspartate(D-aspartate) O-methyltransferase [Parasporobacterium paucivorans]|uniref:Protein-L-isoaspartate O-methyltransferase n=1 Tax=Parasporobacterium paucivorans DSM 15970 TaxID=1122934 RepID=A0A1M6IK27_9FIRM|nr:protein-L-isoaspartate(D-aspartate) O-methyltransferase [Parasporobacterium paucivorans]SHJ34744.1 protein-L-isoaspartate(D-aspartate) O-methyltransferase [Parasporobacterium paucivorans DSM 15970]